jgi:FkbM family methyltransferase
MPTATQLVRVPALGFEIEVLAGDSIIGPAIARGSWADHETRLFRAHLTPGCRVVDLGANIGWFAVQAVLAGAEVHAFEPVPAIAEVCERNVQRAVEHARKAQGTSSASCNVYRIAAGAERGTARIALASQNFGDNRVLDASVQRPQDMGSGREIEIAVAPVDEFVRGPVRFLKVDTQGSEWLALQGARRLLVASPQLAMLIELWPYALRGATAEQLLAFLASEGFTLGKATEAPFAMSPERILRQVSKRDPVRGGIDIYGTRGGLPFHVLGLGARLHGLVRSLKED